MAASHSRAHWLMPTTLVLATVAGVALAYGHHLFYSRLDGIRVDATRWSQSTNISIGTAFTFLVRSALVIAVSAAYWQVFWRRLQRPLTLSAIDDLATQLKDAYQLLNFNNIKISPLLCTLALLAWLVPVAVVFTPSALKVISQGLLSQEMVRMQTPVYNSSDNFVPSTYTGGGVSTPNGMGQTFVPVSAYWGGASSSIRRALFGAAYQGQLPLFATQTVSPMPPNSSYALEIDGPSLKCEAAYNASGLLFELVKAGVQCLDGSKTCSDINSNKVDTTFVSWVANYTYDRWDSDWFATWGRVPYTIGKTEPNHLGTDYRKAQAIFVAYRDNMGTKGASSDDVAVLNCTLYNTTYALAVTYANGEQSVTVQSSRTLNPVGFLSPEAKSLLLSEETVPDFPGAFSLNAPSVKSYLAVMQTLGELLVGSLYHNVVYQTDHTQILSTDLAFTEELWPVYRDYSGLSPEAEPPKVLRPFKDTLEELFQNMTFSLLSVPSVLASQESLTPVSVSYTHNAYVYNPQRLWAPYGAAILATLIAVAVGFFSLAVSGASYSNKFSTIVRVSHDRAIDIAIRDEDRFGQDPLPKYIGNARLFVHGLKGSEKGSLSSSRHLSELREPGMERLMTDGP